MRSLDWASHALHAWSREATVAGQRPTARLSQEACAEGQEMGIQEWVYSLGPREEIMRDEKVSQSCGHPTAV